MTRGLVEILLALVLLVAVSGPSFAVRPDEILPNAAQEARARAISAELRCLVCQNQSIDDSDADLARDLRILVRERIVAGDSNSAVLDYMVARYGEYVLLRPRFNWGNAALWLAGPLALLGGLLAIYLLRRSSTSAPDRALSPDEVTRVEALLARRQGEE